MFPSQIRYVVRKLAHSPMFTGVAVLTLGLAIGANTAVFSVVNGVLLKPLPFDDPERLVGVWHQAPGLGFDSLNQSPALHFTYTEESETFEAIGLWSNSASSVTGLDEPEEVESMFVTASTLPLLGVQAELGRVFRQEDDVPDAPLTVLISHGYWQSRFGGAEGAVGETLRIGGRPHEIIGVLPADLRFLDFDPRLYLPYQFDRAELFMGNFSYQSIARLKDGVTIAQANADVDRMIPMGVEKFPTGVSLEMLREAGFAAAVRPLKQDVVGTIGNTLWILLGTVGLVLLIACANVANLFLVRTDERQQEVAVRSALGASRGQVARGFLLETVVLGALGGTIGLAVAWGGLQLLLAYAPTGLPRLNEIGIDASTMAFTFAISITSGLLFGMFPVLRAGQDFVSALKEGGRGGGAGKRSNRTRRGLVVAQVALAFVLAVGSGLMLRSFQALGSVDPGFTNAEEILTARVTIPSAEIEDAQEVALAHQLIEQKLGELGGVTSVGAVSSMPLRGGGSNDPLEVEGFPLEEGQLPPIRRFKWVTPTYFETTGNPLLVGRGITWADIFGRAPVVVVTENLALEYWDTPAAALGQRLRLPAINGLVQGPWREIIGVVGDVHDDGINQDPTTIAYWPLMTAQFYDEDVSVRRSLVYAIRTARVKDPAFQAEVRDAVWSVNSNLPLANVQTLEEIRRRSMARTSFTMAMLGIAAGAALLLGAVGIYGVSSYVVAQRGREIGIRMALGAHHGNVRGMVLREGMILAGVGLAIGLAAAAALTRLMAALLFGVSSVDPITYAGVAVALASVALFANYVPALRATRVNPAEALRWK